MKLDRTVKVTVWLTRLLSTTTCNQLSHGGLDRDAEQLSPEQFTDTVSCCRAAEPSMRSSEQPSISAAPPDEQSVTEMDSEDTNSGTYNLRHKPLRSKHLLLIKQGSMATKAENVNYLRRAGVSGAAVCVRNVPGCKTGVSTALLIDS